MKKIKLMVKKSEDVQAALVVGGFIVVFTVLAVFFMNA